MTFRLVGFFRRQPAVNQNLTVIAGINGKYVFFVLDTDSGVTYLPVVLDRGFEIVVENSSSLVVALPARIGNGDQWTNVYRECPIVDPTLMPSSSGMWAVDPWGIQLLEAFQLPGGEEVPFVVSPSSVAVSEDERLSIFELYYRAQVGATNHMDESQDLLDIILNRQSAELKSPDVTITSGAVSEDQRSTEYKPEAFRLLQARLVSREWMAAQLNAQGICLSADNDEDWHIQSALINYTEHLIGVARVPS